jgi:hypothetical protein
MWFKANKLTLNFGKTFFMEFTINYKTNININVDCIKTVEIFTTKLLGLKIDDNLNCKKTN